MTVPVLILRHIIGPRLVSVGLGAARLDLTPDEADRLATDLVQHAEWARRKDRLDDDAPCAPPLGPAALRALARRIARGPT